MGADELREISTDEVASHASEQSLWVIIDGVVYDLTKFAAEHPGGEMVLIEQAGKDASESFHDVGHSRDAVEMAKEYAIGRVKQSETTAETAKPASTGGAPAKSEECQSCFIKDVLLSPTWTNFLIPTAIGIGIFVVYKTIISRIF